MKTILLISFITSLTLSSFSQIVSQFEFDSNPVTTATIGPNASSVSGSAISDVNGVGGTNGLNAALPKANLNFTIPGSPTFDLNGIDVSFDFQRDENGGNFWERGNSLRIMGATNLSVSYRVDDGFGGFITVNTGNVYAIPHDDIFRNYRFIYLPVTGEGYVMVNGAVVWYNDGPDGRNMYWVGAGDVVIGSGLDGNGDNKTFLDNVIVGNVLDSGLPIELVYFNAETNGNLVNLDWATASERENDFFTVEKSQDGKIWEDVCYVDGAGTSEEYISYSNKDEKPYNGLSFYRLKQTDFNGARTYSDIVTVEISTSIEWELYPNPATSIVHVATNQSEIDELMVFDQLGRKIEISASLSSNGYTFDVSAIQRGTYLVVVENRGERTMKKLIVR